MFLYTNKWKNFIRIICGHYLLCKHIINRKNYGKEDWLRIQSDSYLALEKLEILAHKQILLYFVI